MRDSANDAFFTAESLENLSEALVREGLQNSLDAAKRGADGVRQVRVRIAFEPKAQPEVRDYLKKQFASAQGNFTQGLGISTLDDLLGPNSGYLVFEDFGTRGLTGDIHEFRLEDAEGNAFFSFFRAEGRSSKSGESLGRWGIGKQVFPTSSRLHAILGVTIRAEAPKRVMMGSAVVRTHSVDGVDYEPDAWFGCRKDDDAPVQPVESGDEIDELVAVFGLTRGNKEGLSIIVPSVDERVNIADLRRGIVRSFFWPIMQGELVVELKTGDDVWVIDAETVLTHRDLLPTPEAAVIELAAWASSAKPSEAVVLSADSAIRPQWSQAGSQLLTEAKLDEIRMRLAKYQRVAVKIPVRVRPKFDGRPEIDSFLTVYLSTCRDSGYRTMFLRDGIVITDIRSPLMSGTRSLVVVDDPPLAGLLGDSEGVNHTQWQKDSRKFHNRYKNGPDTIRFVTRSAYEIMQRLHAAETEGAPELLLHIFYLPEDEGSTEKKKKPVNGKPDVPPPPPPPPPPPKPKPFVVDQVKGGFVIRPGKANFPSLPTTLRVKAGYARRRGNPLTRWAPDDFVFTRAPLRQDPKPDGVAVIREDGNCLEIEIRKPDFNFGITGFDTKRDLVLRVVELKGANEKDI